MSVYSDILSIGLRPYTHSTRKCITCRMNKQYTKHKVVHMFLFHYGAVNLSMATGFLTCSASLAVVKLCLSSYNSSLVI